MKQIWSGIQIAFTAFGGFLGWFLGGVDGFLYALIAFTVIDYITGVMCAITDKNLSSSIGFKGICRKVLIFTLVGIGNIVDVYVLGQGGVLRTAVIFFYLSNEGVSILENSAHLGLPIPEKLKEVLEQLHERGGDDDESTPLTARVNCSSPLCPLWRRKKAAAFPKTSPGDSARASPMAKCICRTNASSVMKRARTDDLRLSKVKPGL